ncbi:MAG: SprT family zinc-dependent metalloprotease [Roseibacillus sp.]
MNPNEALDLLQCKLAEHGLAERGWTGSLDNAERRFGICRPAKREISLSRPLAALNPEEEVLDTILHEIAHALAGIETGQNCGHDERWKAICRRIGARPDRCYDGEEVNAPDAPWVLAHRETGEVFSHHHRKPNNDLSQTFIRGRKAETLGQLVVKPNPQFTTQPVEYFDRPTVLSLQERIMEQLGPLADELGLSLSPSKSQFSSSRATVGLQFDIESEPEDGLSPEERLFQQTAPLFGLTFDDYHRLFQSGGQVFRLVALKPRNRKYPLIAENERGTQYKFPIEVLR